MKNHYTTINANVSHWLFSLLLTLFILSNGSTYAQLSGVKNIPGDYANITAAVTDLNAAGVGAGGVTFNVAAGFTETLTGKITLTATGTISNPIVFQKSGAGANPVLTSYVGTVATPSNVADGFFVLAGSDYVTIDGIDLLESALNTTATTVMEFGYALFKASATNGCQNNLIKNCTITLNRVQNTAWTAPGHNGSIGIAVNNGLNTAAGVLTVTATSGSNSFNKFYTNTIQNCNAGISFVGFAAVTPFTFGAGGFGDTGNDVGGTSAGTGNTILNFGGGSGATNPASGIFANNQWDMNISFNNINSNDGAGVTHVNIVRGIFCNASSTSASLTCNNNTVSVKEIGTTNALTAIDLNFGGTAAGNTITCNNNTVQNCSYPGATTATFTGILNGATAANLVVSGNTITNNSIGSSGTASLAVFQGIYSSVTNTNFTYSNNTITNNTINNQGGTMYCMRGSTGIYTVSGNTVSNNSFPFSGGSLASVLYGFYDLSSPTNETIQNNQFNNFSVTGSTTSTSNIIVGINTNTAAGSKNWSGNTIHTFTFSNSSTGTSTVSGIQSALSTTVNIYKNKIYNLSAAGATSLVNGILVSSTSASGTANIYNNLIGDLKAPTGNNGTTDNIRGLSFTATTTLMNLNVSYNTIYLDATSSGTNFTTSGIFHTISATATTAALTLRNNIIVNKSTPTGTGLAIAYRRSAGAASNLANYTAASNNNLFYAGTPSANNLIYYDGTSSAQTLLAYQSGVFTAGTVAPRDAASVSENPNFSSTSGSSSGFLHINPNITSLATNGAINISGITDDFDAQTRQGNPGYSGSGSAPDIGADEFDPIISATDDIGADLLVTPAALACYSNVQSVVLRIRNYGPAIDFSTSPATVTCNISGTTTATLTATLTGSIPLNGTMNVTLTGTFDMSVNGTYTFNAFTTCATDGNASNDAMAATNRTRLALAAGTLSSNQTSLCVSGTPTLTITGNANGVSQWQMSTVSASGPWTNITGTSTYIPGAPLTQTTYFQVETTCLTSVTSNVVTVTVNNPSIVSTNSPQGRCGTGNVNFTATVSSGATANWYAAASGGTPLASSTLTFSPSVSSTTNYWVAASSGGSSPVVASPTAGTSTFFSAATGWGLRFTVNSALTINTVTVKASNASAGAASMQIKITDLSDVVLYTGTLHNFSITTTLADYVIPVNISLPPGSNYKMVMTSTGINALVRESGGVTFPYNSVGNDLSITAGANGTGTAQTTSAYYWFYNWTISTGCEGTRTMVTANVSTPPTVNASATKTLVCSGGATTLQANSTNDPNYTYTWTPGNLTGASVTVNPATTTQYLVTAVDQTAGAFAGCATTATVDITAQPATPIISGTPQSICGASGSVVLSIFPAPLSGIQWQDSPDGLIYTDISGATSSTYTTPVLSASKYYKAIIKDGTNISCVAPTYFVLVGIPTVNGTTPDTRCGYGSVQLAASVSPSGASANWYTSATGGVPLANGTTFNTPNIAQTTDYYVAASTGSASSVVGLAPTGTTCGTRASSTLTDWPIRFNTTGAITLVSAKVVPVAAGTFTVALRNALSSANLQTATFTWVAGDIGIPKTITLNFVISAAGNYQLTNTVGGVYRISTFSCSYPFTTSSGTFSIVGSASTSTSATATTSYNSFYDITVSEGCESARTLVTATVTPAPPILVNATNAAVCPGGTSNISVTSPSNDPNYSYVWSSSPAGFSASGPGPHTVSPAVTTKYYVIATDNTAGLNADCSMIDSVTITNGGVLVGGTVSAQTTEICLSGATLLTTTASGGAIQWQKSTVSTSGPWTNVGTGASTYNTGTIAQTSYYQTVVSCNASSVPSTNVVTINVNNPSITSQSPASRCGYGSVTLGVTASSGASVNWYNAATGGVSIATGTTFTTPNINATTSYWASATSGGGSTTSLGLANRVGTTTNTGYSDIGLMFDASQPFVLQSVAMYPVGSGAATITIALKDAAGTILQSTTANVTATASPGIKTLIPLNFVVPAGNQHRLVVTAASGLTGLIREITSGFTYPYSLSGVASITSAYTSGASASYYYYFYDWLVSTGCESPRTLVVATVNPAPAINLTSTYPAVCGGGSTTLNVTSPNDPNYSYSWVSNPSGFTASTAGPHAVTPTATTTYILTATDNTAGAFAGCVAKDSLTIVYSAGSPVAGTVSASSTEICITGSPILTVTGAAGGAIQWEASTVSASGPWTNVGTGAATYTATNLNLSTYFRTETSCSGSSVASNAVLITVNNPQLTSTVPGSRIATGTVQLQATPSAGATVNWYAAASGGVSLATGNSFTTPVISTTTNYYASASSGGGGLQFVGKAAPTTALSAVGTYYMVFTVSAPLTIQSVKCYFSGAIGSAYNLNIRDAGTLASVFSQSGLTTVTGTTTPETITLNAVLQPGNYQMGWLTDPGTHRESTGSAYPYTLPGLISITGNTFNDVNYWYYFYDWAIATGCESARQAVTATVVPGALDASISLVSPVSPGINGNNTVSVNITNNSASASITSLNLSYTDGSITRTQAFTGLNIAVGATQLITFTLPYAATGSFTMQAIINTVNGIVDNSQANDVTPIQNVCVGLNGTYTINSALPTSGSNFNNLTDVALGLACGISGPVVFNMQSSFTEQVTIPSILGASAINTITFNGNGNTLSYAATVSTAPHTLALNGADYFRFNDLIIEGTGATYALVCHLWNGADNNMFTNCTFNAPANGTSTTMVPFSISGSATSGTASGVSGNNNIITGCTMFSGYYNTCLVGASGNLNTGNQVINCNIRDQYFYGIYNLYQNGAVLGGNTIERPTRTTLSTFYGIYISTSCTNMLVEKNRIRNSYGSAPTNTGTTYGIYNVVASTSGNENKIYNNLVSDINSAGIIYGIYVNSYDKVYHNTIALNHTGSAATSATYGIYATSGTGSSIKNNIVSITRGGTGSKYCLYYVSTPLASNNNDLYMNATAGLNYVGYSGTPYATLLAWQTANPTFDDLSQSEDPLFLSPGTGYYFPQQALINNSGANVGLVDDIDNISRNLSAPDPGAYEFGIATVPPSCATVTVNNVACITATSISWPLPSGFPTGYKVSFGLTPSADDQLAQADIGNKLSFVFPILQPATTYYYLVQPYNGLGDASGCTIGSFTSGANATQTPTQSPSSYKETMDNGVTPPALPCGMTSSNENFPMDAYTWYTSSISPHAGLRHLRIDKNPNNTTAKDDWFYSAPMNITAGHLYRIYFWHRISTAGNESFEVFLSNSNDAATMLTTSSVFTGSSNLTTYKLDSSSDIIPLTSGVYYYGFHANGGANGRSLYMDDIQIKEIPVAALNPASCVTIPSMYDQLLVQPVFGAQDYKFKIENLANSFSYEYTRNLPIPDFRLKWAPGVVYDLTYDVSVSYKKNNVWSPYGASCPVTMGPFPTTKLRGASCGATLTDMYTPLYIDSVSGANDYEYRIVQNTLAYDHTWMRGAPALDYRLYWAYQTSPTLVDRIPYGFTYDVQVRALVGRTGPAQGNLPGVFGTFGPVCTVTLAGQPQTQLKPTSCGITLASITDQIFCVPVTGASNYRYHVVNTALGYDVTAMRNSSVNDYRLTWLPTVGGVGLRFGTTYDITVSDYVGGVWSTEGPMCQVTTPAQPMTQLQPAYCLYTLPTFSTTIYSTAIAGATNYRYRITDVATSGATYTKIVDRNSPGNDFKFSWTLVCCGGLNMLPNQPYHVEVASYAGGVWSAYGTMCTVTTSATIPRYTPFLAEEGLVEGSQNLNLSVYPNPAAVAEEFAIELSGIQAANEKVELSIYNMLGERAYRSEIVTKTESNLIIKPEQVLAPGVYMVEAKLNGAVYREKFVVK